MSAPRTGVLHAGAVFLPDGSEQGRKGTDLSRGVFRRVAVYAPTQQPVEPGVYDPPREILGATPFQVLAIAFDVVRRFVDAHPDAFYAEGPPGAP